MGLAVMVIAFFAVVALVRHLGSRLTLPEPVLLLLVGLGVSFIPGVPDYRVPSELVLVVVLPLVLYAGAFTASMPGVRANLRSVGMLSVGLTLFTTVLVAVVAHVVVPGMSWAVAFVLGAIVAPPDAVAAIAVGRKAGMPKRVVTILEGESLFNDAAALTAYSVAVTAVVGGSIGFGFAIGRFALAAFGGLAVGAVVALVLAWIRNRLRNSMSDTAVSLLAPFVAYLPAEAFHASGLVAVVVVGLYLGHRAPSLLDATSRLLARSVWEVIDYLATGAVFLLIGLQLSRIIADLGRYSPGVIALSCVAVVATLIVTRIVWMFPGAYVPQWLSKRIRANEGTIDWREPAIASWAGMRGVVSFGAAIALPLTLPSGAAFPERALLLFITFVAITSTLLLHGLTLPGVVRGLKPSTGHGEQRADQASQARQASADAARRRLDELLDNDEQLPTGVVERLKQRVERGEMLATGPGEDSAAETPSAAYRRLRRQMLAAARERVTGMRDTGELDEENFRSVMRELDLEESLLFND